MYSCQVMMISGDLAFTTVNIVSKETVVETGTDHMEEHDTKKLMNIFFNITAQ